MRTRSTAPRATQENRRARGAVTALFLTNGALVANILPRYPEIKADLGLDNTMYGIAVAFMPIGAIVAGLLAGALIRRFGSGPVAVIGTILTSIAVVTAGIAPVVAVFMLALFIGGGMDAITDVAQNAHGMRVQRRYGRSIINSFHAAWSMGAVLGGGMAAGAIALHVPRGIHLAISGILFSVVALVALRFCLRGHDDERDLAESADDVTAPRRGVTVRMVMVLIALVIIAMAGTVVEDAGNSWAALSLTSIGAPSAIAALGFIALVGAQFIGRLIGDRMVDRFGQRMVARAGGVIVFVGMGLALAFPSVPGMIAGFAAAGLGVATLVPAAMHEADEMPGLKHGTGLTVVSWLMRLGFLLSPPIVGMIADATSLRTGLMIVPAAGVLVIVASGVLQKKRPVAEGAAT